MLNCVTQFFHDDSGDRPTDYPPFRRILLGKYLRKIIEAFEFERVAAGIEEEHRRLLADLAGETDLWFDDELDAFRF